MVCKVIAEIGQNHEGDFELLKELSESAIAYNADIIKFQYWNIDNVYNKEDVRYDPAKKRELNFQKLFGYIKDLTKRNIPVMLSIFGDTNNSLISRIMHTNLKNFTFKIASQQANHFLQSEFISQRVFVSLGCYQGSLDALPENYTYFACQTQYPVINPRPSLLQLVDLKKKFLRAGYSCHYKGLDAVKAAILLGADYIEKHYTFGELRETSLFRDHICSMTPAELNELIDFRDEVESHNDSDYIDLVNDKRRLKL